MKTRTNPTAYIVVKSWPGGKRENVIICLNENRAREYAQSAIGENWFVHLETCVIYGNFIINDNNKFAE